MWQAHDSGSGPVPRQPPAQLLSRRAVVGQGTARVQIFAPSDLFCLPAAFATDSLSLSSATDYRLPTALYFQLTASCQRRFRTAVLRSTRSYSSSSETTRVVSRAQRHRRFLQKIVQGADGDQPIFRREPLRRRQSAAPSPDRPRLLPAAEPWNFHQRRKIPAAASHPGEGPTFQVRLRCGPARDRSRRCRSQGPLPPRRCTWMRSLATVYLMRGCREEAGGMVRCQMSN